MTHLRPPRSPHRAGSLIVLVLLILIVAVMLSATFIALMTAYRASGTRQSARQIAAQTALAGAVYCQQIVMRDYAMARSGGIPQRYNEVPMVTNPRNTSGGTISGGIGPRVYAGPIPASRVGLDWLLPFEGRLYTAETADFSGSVMARYTYAANRHPNAPGGIETTRQPAIDSVGDQQAVPVQYGVWKDFQYQLINDNYSNISTILPFLTPFNDRVQAQPRWVTAGYYDINFQPLEWADRDTASYEARFAVTPFPLDGCINVNFSDRILSSTSGGLYRLGYRNPDIPPGALELSDATRTAAENAAKALFNADAMDVDQGNKALLTYPVGGTATVNITTTVAYQAYQVTDADKDWVGKSFPLSHQYAASLTNMLGSLILRDGGSTVQVRKMSAVTWPVKYTSYVVGAAMVLTGGKKKASSGIGDLSMLVNIALGQGYRGNRVGYNPALPGDPWYAPQAAANAQVGTPASWRQMHADMGFTSYLDTTITHGDGVLPISTFALTPFGDGLDQTRTPPRNRGSPDKADIDCPWYVNALLMSQSSTKAMICAMDATWYRDFHDPFAVNSGTNGYPLHKGNLLPIPPPKADPMDSTKIAVWDDGVACTGADGVEGGALPPIMPSNTVLSTTYLRPAWHRNDVGYHFADPFVGNAYLSWKNPIRDQAVTRYAPPGVPAAPPLTGNDQGMISDYGMSYYGHVFSHPTVSRVIFSNAEDHISEFAIGGDESEAASVENVLGTDVELSENKDMIDERLAWQNDIVSALLKTMVDLRSNRSHGKKLRATAPHGYEIIEDVETVFLGYLGVSVHYSPAVSKASTVASTAADYAVYYGLPGAGDATYPLGRSNQLWSLSQLTSAGPGSKVNEVGYDRGRDLSTSSDLPYDSTGIITAGTSGQFGYRHYAYASSAAFPNSVWPTHAKLPGWPFPAAVLPSPPSASDPYRPTWAALSRVMEHRLNDVRMSLFGTPALDLNGDRIIDATTNDGTGVVTSEAIGNSAAQLRFSSTGRLYLGQNRYWRVFINSELWDRRGDTLAEEATLEQVIVVDPDGNGDLSDSHVLFSRWHGANGTSGRSGPSTVGRTEATLP
jgi:hypothetical protein